MINELMRVWEGSRLNRGQPESLFNPTLIFNEGWLLRGVLRQWKLAPGKSRLPFLPFPTESLLRRPVVQPICPAPTR